MPRLLVVSHRSSLAMGLSNTEYDVIDVRPDGLVGTLDKSNIDVCVIGIDDPLEALSLVETARKIRDGIPLLLVSGTGQGWQILRSQALDGVEIVPLPVTRPALLTALTRLTEQRPAAPAEEAPVEEPAPRAELTATGKPSSAHAKTSSAQGLALSPDAPRLEQPAAPSRVEPESTPRVDHLRPPTEAAPAGATPAAGQPETVSEPESQGEHKVTTMPVSGPAYGHIAAARLSAQPRRAHAIDADELPAATAERVEEDSPPPRTPPRVFTRPRSAPVSRPPSAPASQPPSAPVSQHDDPTELARRLLATADALVGVPETGELVVAEAVARTGATAGVLMLPDGNVWRVAGGVRLRALERRCLLAEDSWLVETVARGVKGVIVEQTDIARQRLHGAPLANRQQLLAAPVPGLDGVLLMARDELPFTEAELEALAALGREAVAPLRDALDVRELARQLEGLRNLPE